MAKFMDKLFEFAGWSRGMTLCKWMEVRALIITPSCWFGSYPYSCLVLVMIYLSMAATGYFELGELALDDGDIVCALCEGGVGYNVFNFNIPNNNFSSNLVLKCCSLFTPRCQGLSDDGQHSTKPKI